MNRQDPAEPAPDPDDLLTVGEMSARTGVAVSALHYYESLGLIASSRTHGNQRRYPRHMIRRIALVVVAKRLGIPLTDVSDVFAALPLDRMPPATSGSGCRTPGNAPSSSGARRSSRSSGS